MAQRQRRLYLKVVAVIAFWLLGSVGRVQLAGGRGGAIATKGGSRGPAGPRKSDPNDDTGSLSVILVVILPVAQMFLFVALIILVRMCYRNYCLKSKPPKAATSGFGLNRKLSPKGRRLEAAAEDTAVEIAVTESSLDQLPHHLPEHHFPEIVDIVEGTELQGITTEPVPGSSRASSGSTAPPNGSGGGLICRASRSSSSVSPIELPVTANCTTRPLNHYPFRANHYKVATLTSSLINHHPHHHPQPPPPPPSSSSGTTTHSLPISLPHQLPHPQMFTHQRAILQRSNTLTDAVESLTSETIGSDDEARCIDLPVDFEISDTTSGRSSHQSECIYHPRNHMSTSSRPTSVSSGTFKCMQTY